MSAEPEFKAFPSIPRLMRDIVVTEKIDGTNAQVHVTEDGRVIAGSRTRWITPQADNFGFAAWVKENEHWLVDLGPGSHFGEWWGAGIQRRYDRIGRTFSLFNTHRWADPSSRPECCDVVPVLYTGPFDMAKIDDVLMQLQIGGSVVAPGFMSPEGIVIYHSAAKQVFKRCLDKHDGHKGHAYDKKVSP